MQNLHVSWRGKLFSKKCSKDYNRGNGKQLLLSALSCKLKTRYSWIAWDNAIRASIQNQPSSVFLCKWMWTHIRMYRWSYQVGCDYVKGKLFIEMGFIWRKKKVSDTLRSFLLVLLDYLDSWHPPWIYIPTRNNSLVTFFWKIKTC